MFGAPEEMNLGTGLKRFRFARRPLCALSCSTSNCLALLAAIRALLNGRTRHVTVGAKHAAIARQWPENLAASLAVVEELTSIRWHFFLFDVSAFWARQR